MHFTTRPKATRKNQHVAPTRILHRKAWLNQEASASTDRRIRYPDSLDAEQGRSISKAGDCKHFERTGKVQHFNVVEHENLHVTR